MQNKKPTIQMYMTTSLLTVRSDETVAEARRITNQNWIRHLPVVNNDGFVLGMISDRDLASASNDTLISSIMSQPTRIVNIHDGLESVIDLMMDSKISSCLIEQDGEVVGIVTSDDLLRVLRDHLTGPAGGSIRTALYNYVIKYPLGAAAQVLANVGI